MLKRVRIRLRDGERARVSVWHPAEYLIAAIVVEHETREFSFAHHPFERELRETAVGLVVTAAHVGVNAGEPHLLDVLVAVEKIAGVADSAGLDRKSTRLNSSHPN